MSSGFKKALFVIMALLFLSGVVFFNYSQNKTGDSLELDSPDITILDGADPIYTENVDVFIQGEWAPENYVNIERKIDLPEYDFKFGNKVKEEWNLFDNLRLVLNCEQGRDSGFIESPSSSCSLRIELVSDPLLFYNINQIRGFVTCDSEESEDCQQKTGFVLYEDDDLENKYLFLSDTYYWGNENPVKAYEIVEDGYIPLYFDLNGKILEEISVGGILNFSFVFTDESKKDFRLITSVFDQNMEDIARIYYEWRVEDNRLTLDKKIVSIL